jgi:hypothetical protein
MITTISLLIPLLAPLILTANLARLIPKSRLEWILAAWLTLAFSGFYYLTGAWYLFSIYVRYAMAVLVLIAIVVTFIRLPRDIPFTDFDEVKSKFTLTSYLVPALIFSVMIVLALQGLFYSGQAVSLAFPLQDGTFYIAQAGATSAVNAHHPYGSQTYAVDILKLNRTGRNAAGFNQTSLEQYAIFGSPIYSPCDGMVAAAIDGIDDLPPGSMGDMKHAAGNHVYIDCQVENVQVLLAHMQKGSLLVSRGDRIQTGQPIGTVGNSGNTGQPHLHIHARQGGTPDSLISGIGVPIFFRGRFLIRNDFIIE